MSIKQTLQKIQHDINVLRFRMPHPLSAITALLDGIPDPDRSLIIAAAESELRGEALTPGQESACGRYRDVLQQCEQITAALLGDPAIKHLLAEVQHDYVNGDFRHEH